MICFRTRRLCALLRTFPHSAFSHLKSSTISCITSLPQLRIMKSNVRLQDVNIISDCIERFDVENHYLVKRYNELKVEYQTQENDRQMLLKEVVLQKNRKELLSKKIDYYKEQVQRAMLHSAEKK